MTASARLETLREQVATACRILGLLEMSTPTQGHVSARVPGEPRCLIRARGPDETGLRYTGARDVILVDFDGRRSRRPTGSPCRKRCSSTPRSTAPARR